MAPGRMDGRVVPTATSGAAPRARRPRLLTMAPPMPNRALRTPVVKPRRRVRVSRASPGSMALAGRGAQGRRHLRPGELLEGVGGRPHTPVVVGQEQALVGGVDLVGGEHDPEVDANRAEGVGQGPFGARPALAVEQRLLAERPGHGLGGGAVAGVVERGEGRLDPAEGADRDLDVGGHPVAGPALEQRLQPGRLLIGDEPERHLGVGGGRDDGLGPGPAEAAPDAVDVGRGAARHPLEGRVALLAGQRADPGDGHELAGVERQGGEVGPLLVGQLDHVVVPARDGDATGLVLEPGQQRHQLGQGVGDGAPEGARVQVGRGGAQVDLEVDEPAHGRDQRRHVLGDHPGVGDTDQVTGQPVGVLAQERVDRRRPRLLLALDEELDVDRQAPVGGQQMPDGRDLEVDLALVVGGAAGVQVAVAHGRLERRGGPLLQRVGRLHVVVAVHGDRRLLGPGPQPLAVHGRLAALGGQDLGVEPGRLHQSGQVLGRAADVAGALGVAGDRGDGAPLGQLANERVRLGLHEGVDVGHGDLPGSTLKWAKRRQEAIRGPGVGRGPAGPCGWPYPAGMMSTVRIGMVGAGAVAARHLRSLLAMDGVEVAAVADPALERAKELAAEAGAPAYPNHMELLAAERLDAVYICVPPFAHGAPELAVIDAGLPMFVEKPVAIDQETATTIAARLAGRPLVTCTGYHWPWLDKIPPPPWWLRRDGSGGQTIEQTTHVLDTARGLAGEVVEVHAFATRAASTPALPGSVGEAALPGADIHDVSVASLRFASGAVGTVASTCLLPRLQRAGVQVVADGLSLELSETELLVEVDGRRDAWTAEGSARPRPDRDFVAAVRGGENRIRVPWFEAYRTHLLACAITRSADEGRPLPVGQGG